MDPLTTTCRHLTVKRTSCASGVDGVAESQLYTLLGREWRVPLPTVGRVHYVKKAQAYFPRELRGIRST